MTGLEARTLVAPLEELAAALVGLTARSVAESPAADLTLAQWRGLVVVAGADGLRVGEIASRLGMSMPSASRLLRRLQARGLLTIVVDPADRRAALVRATRTGLDVRDDVIRRRTHFMLTALDTAATVPPDAARIIGVIAAAFQPYR
jgi:DNA-binding MarR family transcriptional regulator